MCLELHVPAQVSLNIFSTKNIFLFLFFKNIFLREPMPPIDGLL